MNRRSGQNGTIVIQSGFYRVRWRMDIEGQEKRQNMSATIAPVVLDKHGNPEPAPPKVQRMAKEIVECTGANAEQRFNRVVLGEATHRDQAKDYLHWPVTRDREPIKDASRLQAALNKWILPAIGDTPLANVNNITVKPLVDKMKKSLSARTVNTYVEYIKQVVASYLKTDAACRDIDLNVEVAGYLRAFINGREGLLFETRNGTPYLHNNLESRWLTFRLAAMRLDEKGMGFHAFRRFRKTSLRGKRSQEDINNFWMGHKPKTMSELYSRMDEELEQRLEEAKWLTLASTYPKLLQTAPRHRSNWKLKSQRKHCKIIELLRMRP